MVTEFFISLGSNTAFLASALNSRVRVGFTEAELNDFPTHERLVVKDETNAVFVVTRQTLTHCDFSIIRYIVSLRSTAAKFTTFGRQFAREANYLYSTGRA